MLQLAPQRTKYLVPRVGAVVIGQFLDGVRLRVVEESPKEIFSDKMFCIRDVGLFEYTILVLPDRETPRYAPEISTPVLFA